MVTLFDIKRFALHDGPGIRTTLFMKGCPLSCAWCHNPESIDPEPETAGFERQVDGKVISCTREYGYRIEEEKVIAEVVRDRIFYEESGGGVTFSGGEPLLQPGALVRLLTLARNEGLHTALDTSGYASREVLEKVAAHTDLFLYDLKHPDNGIHKRYTGVGNRLIMDNAELLLEKGQDVIFRIPLVPGVNTGREDLDRWISWFSTRKAQIREIHLLPYHKTGSDKYRRLHRVYGMGDLEPMPDQELRTIKEYIASTGIPVTVGG